MKRIHPLRFNESPITLKNIVELFDASSYQARSLARACAIYKKMLEGDAIIGLTLAGAMTPAGIGGYISQMIEKGFIDFIVTTGANITHDTHFPLGGRVVRGEPETSDTRLLEDGIERIYDTYLMPEALTFTGEAVRNFLESEKLNTPLSSSEFHYKFGHYLNSVTKEKGAEKLSFLIASSFYDVPVWTPAFGDSEIGMVMALVDMDSSEKNFSVSSSKDVKEMCALVHGGSFSNKIGAIAVGGGSPKNFFTQTSPLLIEDIYLPEEIEMHPGHDYIIKITTDSPVYGGCSGATPSENVSWKKLNPNILDSGEVVVHADATIVLPILFGFALSEVRPKKPKRLYKKLPNFLKDLKDARKERIRKHGIKSFRKGA